MNQDADSILFENIIQIIISHARSALLFGEPAAEYDSKGSLMGFISMNPLVAAIHACTAARRARMTTDENQIAYQKG